MLFQPLTTASERGGAPQTRGNRFSVWMAVFLLSSLAFSAIGTYSSWVGMAASTLLRFAVCCVCAFVFKAVDSAKSDMRLRPAIFAAILGGVLLWQVAEKAVSYPTAMLPKGVMLALALLAIPAAFLLTYAALQSCARQLKGALKEFIQQTTRFESLYLWIAFSVMTLACVLLYLNTNVFYETVYQGKFVPYDVLFTSDSAVILQGNAYFDIYHVTNDLRQPLFGLFAMPFVLPATALAKTLFFFPQAYPILINLTQIFLVLVTILMIVRLLDLDLGVRPFAVLLLSVTYPVLLFSLNLEQYVFAVFWLVLFLYLAVKQQQGREIVFLAMAGSLVTSGVFFPFLSSEEKLSARIRSIFKTLVLFFVIVILLNRQYVFLTGLSYFKHLVGSYGGTQIPLLEKVQQFLAMLESIFIRPETQWTTFSAHPAYLLSPVTGLHFGGLAVLLLAIVGFGLNYRNRFAQFSFLFVLLSVALHVVVGWGAIENGMTLYAYYYLWAYFSLIVLGLEKLLSPLKRWRLLVYGLAIVALAVVNFAAIADIVRFGLTHYPV